MDHCLGRNACRRSPSNAEGHHTTPQRRLQILVRLTPVKLSGADSHLDEGVVLFQFAFGGEVGVDHWHSVVYMNQCHDGVLVKFDAATSLRLARRGLCVPAAKVGSGC